MKVYTIYDRVREESGALLLAKNDGQAIRDFLYGIPAEKKQDFRLMYLGEYNHEKMTFDLLSQAVEVQVVD